jgi:hypothetical protein
MKRRYLKLAGLTTAGIFVVLGVLALLPNRPDVTKANFDRIQDGMAIREVEVILGGTGQPFHGFSNRGPTLVWLSDDGAMAFVEVSDNAVASKTWRASDETILDKVHRWLHLRK